MLEIGLWKTLKKMTEEVKTMSPHELLEYILQNQVPRLDFYTGRDYRNIVENCLKGQVGMESMMEENRETEFGRFGLVHSVEEQLAACSLSDLFD